MLWRGATLIELLYSAKESSFKCFYYILLFIKHSSTIYSFIKKDKEMPVSTLDARERVFSFVQAKNTTVAQKVKEAILALDNGSKGSSVSAITTWILGNYSIMDPNRLKINVKKSITKSLENGTLRRSSSSKGAQGPSGSFILPKDLGKSGKTKASLSISTSALSEKQPSDKDLKAKIRKSLASKANTLRESKKFPKIREIGIKADKFSTSDFLKLLEK